MNEIEVMTLVNDMYDASKGIKSIDADITLNPYTKTVKTLAIHIRMVNK